MLDLAIWVTLLNNVDRVVFNKNMKNGQSFCSEVQALQAWDVAVLIKERFLSNGQVTRMTPDWVGIPFFKFCSVLEWTINFFYHMGWSNVFVDQQMMNSTSAFYIIVLHLSNWFLAGYLAWISLLNYVGFFNTGCQKC